MENKNFSRQVIKGGFWVFALHIVSRSFYLIRTIILAHVLAPNDFGLMGIALLFMSTLETFSQTGFNQALIQKKKNIKPFLDVVWTVQALRGFFLFILLFFGAPFVASFFHTPEAEIIIRVIGLAVLLKGFINIGVVYFQKELEFQKQFFYQIGGVLADLTVAIPAALILKSVWALVFGLLAREFIQLLFSYLLHPYRPKIRLNIKKAKELFGFGQWLLGASIFIFLLTKGDDALVGKLLGVAALGFYQMAYNISNLPATEITHVISQIAFPVYSKLQDNLPRLRRVYLKTLQLITVVSLPLSFLIFLLAPEFTRVFLGLKWLAMVPAMQILCILGAIRSIAAASGPIFLAVGRPDIEAKLPIGQLVLLAILIYPLTKKWGITGTALSISIVSCSFIFIILAIIARLIKMGRGEVLILARNILFPLLAIIPLMPLKILIIKPLIKDDVFVLGGTILTGAFIYSINFLILERYVGYNIRKDLEYIIKKLRK